MMIFTLVHYHWLHLGGGGGGGGGGGEGVNMILLLEEKKRMAHSVHKSLPCEHCMECFVHKSS